MNYDEGLLKRVAANARHDSVTPENLSLDSDSVFFVFNRRWISKPVISYLDISSEQPHVLLKSRDPVVVNDEKQRNSGYGSVLVITNRRMVLLIGRETGDRVLSIPLSNEISFTIEPTARSANQSLIVTSFEVNFRILRGNSDIVMHPDSEFEYEDVWIISDVLEVISDGALTWDNEEWWLDRAEAHDRVYDLADRARSTSVTPSRVAMILPDLYENENPEFVLENGELRTGIEDTTAKDFSVVWRQNTTYDWAAITSESVLIGTYDDVEELPHKEVDSVGVVVIEERDEYQDNVNDVLYFEVWSGEFLYLIEANELSEGDARRAVQYIRDRI